MQHSRSRVRSFLVPILLAGAVLAGCGGGGSGGGGGDPDVERLPTATHFPQSVASGDPRESSVVLWTRVVDPDDAGDLEVRLVVAGDEALDDVVVDRKLTALADDDHCVKTRITGLRSGRHYWYRFVYENEDGEARSRRGRTKTAPAADAEVTVRWAFFSCQDFVERFYNAYAHLLETRLGSDDDLDFLVFLGDYVYENTGGTERAVVFEDEAGAIPHGSTFSARSLANYRTLYKTYRTDPMLQRLHESYPMIAVWDDHEFSNDSHGATATYTGGRTDEIDAQRKSDAERAFFEFMPIEVGLGPDGTLAVDASILWPNTRIHDRFRFGAHCEVFLTDARSHRRDHLIPEDAFPGTILLDEPATEAVLGVGNGLEPYVDMDAPANAALRAAYLAIVTGAYRSENSALDALSAGILADAAVGGLQAARVVNGTFAAAGQPEPFDATALATLPRGIGYVTLGKQSLYGSQGSRYGVSHDLLPVLAALVGDDLPGVLGASQATWLIDGVAESPATWKVVGSSVSAVPMVLDFGDETVASFLPDEFPDEYRIRLQLNADQWDGFPLAKQELLTSLSAVPGVVIMSGDIHSSWLADHGDRSGIDPAATHRVHEFTGVAVSSGTFQAAIESQIGSIVDLDDVDLGVVLSALEVLFVLSGETAPASQPSRVVYDDLGSHGYVVLEAGPDALRGTYHHIPADEVFTSYYDDVSTLLGLFRETVWEIRDGILDEVD